MDPAAPAPAPGFPAIPLPALDNTMGAWLIGTFVGILLQGVAYHQTYHYFRLYPKDPRYLKLWVVIIQIVETINTVLSMHTAYYNLVTNYANPLALLRGPVWSLKLLPVPGSIAAVMTQLFFARRVYMLKKRYRPIAIIAAVLTVSFSGCYMALTGLGWNAPNITQFLKFSWLPSLGSAMIMVGDLMMTTVLIYFLHQNRTGVTRTDSMVDVIIMYTVSTGLIICIFNVLNVTFSLVWPDNLIYAGTSIVLTKLYSNTFLVSLNARQSLINRGVVMEATSPFTSAIVGKHGTRSTGNSSHGPRRRVQVPLEIKQHVSSVAVTDGSSTIELKKMPSGLELEDVDHTHIHTMDKEPVRSDSEDMV